MRTKKPNFQILLVLLVLSFLALDRTALAQSVAANQPSGNGNTKSRILYHDGRVLAGPVDVYFVWYGCWDNTCGLNGDVNTQNILTDFMSNIGATPYSQILTLYPDGEGHTTSGAMFFGGEVYDHYSRGTQLTVTDIQAILSDQITNRHLPEDSNGIYILLASADVTSISTGFCVPSAPPHHGIGVALGSEFRYGFLGNPVQCPSIAAPQFFSHRNVLPTPNENLAADAMVSSLAHVLDTTITDPWRTGWYDRYGLENADKCDGQFGTTYLLPNGARANMRLGQRDYLIQENWVNIGRGHCALDSSL